ncbi:MAG: DUF302 domain-containing protein [Pseudomonadota bacterium]
MLRLLISAYLAAFLLISPAKAHDDGIKTIPAAKDAAATLEQLKEAIKARGMKLFTTIDHAAAAREFGLDMPPSTVVIFGNPKGGTPNFIRQPTLAIDLPLKMLVWQDKDGNALVTYNTGDHVLGTIYSRHGLKPPAAAAQRLENVLGELAREAAQ